MKAIKLVITDIDGVWTDGGMYYDQDGFRFKRYNTTDSGGVSLLRHAGIPLAIISGENCETVLKRAEKLKIENVFIGIRSKIKVAELLCARLNITMDQIAFIGNDINDIPLLKAAGYSAVPADTPERVKKFASKVLQKKGGEGVFREFTDDMLDELGYYEGALEKYLTALEKDE